MAKVTYLGSDDPTENTECEVFGLSFTKGVAVEVDSVAGKLRTNPMFAVEDRQPEPVRPVAPPDLDGDGEPGGSQPVSDDKAAIRAEIKALGGKPPHHAKSIEEHLAVLEALKAG
jgi:hypothetical protein